MEYDGNRIRLVCFSSGPAGSDCVTQKNQISEEVGSGEVALGASQNMVFMDFEKTKMVRVMKKSSGDLS